jgi:hypothetical protein
MSKESNIRKELHSVNPSKWYTAERLEEEGVSVKKDTIKYSEINDWVINFMENCSAESIVDIFESLNHGMVLDDFEIEWDK